MTDLNAGGDVQALIAGGGAQMRFLPPHGPTDERRLLIYPPVLGTGHRPANSPGHLPLRLTDSRTFTSGVVALPYQIAARS